MFYSVSVYFNNCIEDTERDSTEERAIILHEADPD